MKLNIIFALSVSTLLLSACSSNKSLTDNPAAQIVGAPSQQSATAQSYAAAVQTQFQRDGQGFKINALTAPANQVYYFGFDQSTMRPQDLKALMVQSSYLASHPKVKVRLEGNTDNRGSREYNIALGWRRDQTVARIIEQQGVQPQQLDMISYGKERPAAFGNSDTDWALNRRVNFIYEAN